MAKEKMTSKRYYIGMDVHKDFVQMAVFLCRWRCLKRRGIARFMRGG